MSDDKFRICNGEDNRRRQQHNLEIVGDGGAAIDRFFDALGKTRRRVILRSLTDTENANLHQLAESIAEYEEGESSEEQIESIRLDLHHHHVPKLAEYGLISYDTRTNMMALEPLPETAQEILDLVNDLEEEKTQ